MNNMVCILCPKGCLLNISDNLIVSGNICQNGEMYAQEEVLNPLRTLTSTVWVKGAALRRCPVKSRSPIPKELVFEAMQQLDSVVLVAPVEEGQVVVENICGTGIPFVATRSINPTV